MTIEQKFKEVNKGIIELMQLIQEAPSNKSNIDLELADVLHSVEMTANKDVIKGYEEYKILRDVLRRRRKINTQNSLAGHLNMSGAVKTFNTLKSQYITFCKQASKYNTDESIYKVRVLNDVYGNHMQKEYEEVE